MLMLDFTFSFRSRRHIACSLKGQVNFFDALSVGSVHGIKEYIYLFLLTFHFPFLPFILVFTLLLHLPQLPPSSHHLCDMKHVKGVSLPPHQQQWHPPFTHAHFGDPRLPHAPLQGRFFHVPRTNWFFLKLAFLQRTLTDLMKKSTLSAQSAVRGSRQKELLVKISLQQRKGE